MPDEEQRLTTDDLSSSPDRGAGQEPTGEGEPAREDQRDRQGAGDPGQATSANQEGSGRVEGEEPLLPPNDLEELRRRWDSVQTQFVDEPRRAVEDADELVAEVMRKLADTFSSERSSLEEQWERAGEADTETLRVTLQRYRSFFNRLLSA